MREELKQSRLQSRIDSKKCKFVELSAIEKIDTAEMATVSGGSFTKTMDKIGKAINESDPYAIYSH